MLFFEMYMHYAYVLLHVLCKELFQPEPVPSDQGFEEFLATSQHWASGKLQKAPHSKQWCSWGGGGSRNLAASQWLMHESPFRIQHALCLCVASRAMQRAFSARARAL